MSCETEACGGNNIETYTTCERWSSEKWRVGKMSVKLMLRGENVSGTMSCETEDYVMNNIVTCREGQMLEIQMLHVKCQWDKCCLWQLSVRQMPLWQMSCDTEDCGINNIETDVSNMGTHAIEANVTYDKCQSDKCYIWQMLHMTNASGTIVSDTYVVWDKWQ